MPEPKPSSCGRCSQAIPVCNTNEMPWNTSRSGYRLRPGCRARWYPLPACGLHSVEWVPDVVGAHHGIGCAPSVHPVAGLLATVRPGLLRPVCLVVVLAHRAEEGSQAVVRLPWRAPSAASVLE